ncbi:conserved protein of unknown function [Bradyrhizobium vignae]|uniref:Ku protein n=1 Tax=Bradyrhizobium vignae TaxID=1549949 RepID=A0A2U3PU51_9BRAD|nr:conserved protein of unknown function [Bradyrhizobium vignae]
MLDLAKHIVNQKAGHFEPDKFEDQYETALIELINQKRAGKPITAKASPRGENVVDLMDALRKSIGRDATGPDRGAEESSQDAAQGGRWAEANADADHWQKIGQGDGEKARRKAAAKVGRANREASGVLSAGCRRWKPSDP